MSNVPSPALTPAISLTDARDWLRAHLDSGARCPCCTQFAKIYRRKVNSTMARALVILYRAGKGSRREWVNLTQSLDGTGLNRGGQVCQLSYWRLLEEQSHRAPGAGAGRVGWWRVTALGEQWLLEQTSIPKYARIYDGRVLGRVGDPVKFRDALGTKFDYDQLMSGI